MRHACAALAILIGFAAIAPAQTPDTSAEGRLGRHPFASYFDSQIDSIDLYNGNLMLNINLFSLPGRELSDGLHLSYNARGWTEGPVSGLGYYAGGWRIHGSTGRGFLEMTLTGCTSSQGDWNAKGTYVDAAGIYHIYHATYHGGACSQSSPPTSNLTLTPDANDKSVMTTDSSGIVHITFADGSVYDDNLTGMPRMTSRNGNYLDFNTDGSATAAQDTLGRAITFSPGSGSPTTPLCDYYFTDPVEYTKTYTIKDSTGTNQDYAITLLRNRFTHNPIEHCGSHLDDFVKRIDLPNGKHYDFVYDNWQGYLTKVTLPSGAYIEYDYKNGNESTSMNSDYVVARHVTSNGTTAHWYYVRTEVGDLRTNTVTSPEGHIVAHVFGTVGEEIETYYYNAANEDPQLTVGTGWDSGRPVQVVTTAGPLIRKTIKTWDGPLLTQQDDSNWYGITDPINKHTRTLYSYTTSAPFVPTEIELQEWDGTDYVQTGRTTFQYDQDTPDSTADTVNKTAAPSVRGNVTSVRRYYDASHYVTAQFEYDDVGNVVEAIDELGHSTIFDFTDNFTDSTNHHTYAFPKSVKNDLDQMIFLKYEYNTGLVKDSTDLRGNHTLVTYDEMNRPLEITEPGGRVTQYDYDDTNRKVTEDVLIAASLHRKSETTLDQLGRPILTKLFGVNSSDDVFVETAYDMDGRVQQVSEPYRSGATKVWTVTAYDGLNRPITITNPDTTSRGLAYYGNITTMVDEAGNYKRLLATSDGQISRVEEPNPDDAYSPFFTDYSYYAFGPLHEVSQGGQTRTFTYDWLGRKLNEVHPETATSTGHDYSYAYTYNDAGLLTSRTDVRGIQTDYSYDNINRLTGINYYDTTPDITLTYDQGGYTGLLTTAAVTGVKSSSFAYNTAGNLASEAMTLTGADGTFTTSYTYDYDGRLLSATYPSGRLVTSSYAAGTYASDRLASLSANYLNSPILLQSITANAAGLLTSRTIGDGLTQAQSYNPRNQITRIAAAANGTTLLDLGFSYGSSNDGRIHTRTDAVQPEHSAAYTYDPIGRLTEVAGTSSSWGVSWTMDRWGNRTHQYPDSSGLASTRQIGTQNISYPNGNNRNSDWSYDAAGNVTNDGTNYYCYDAENRLTELSTSCSGAGSTRYVYDEAGRRIKKIALEDESSVTTYYFYGLTGLMSEFSTSTARSNHTAAASNDRVVYPVGEQTGTPVMLVASNGTPRENNRVFPYGQSWNAVAGSETDQKFTTYQRDESGLDYAMARHYDKVVGRFLTPDPGHVGASIQDPQSWNPYAYSRNDPINLVDPAGLRYSFCVDPKESNGCYDANDDEIEYFLNRDGYSLTNPYSDAGDRGYILFNGKKIGDFVHLYLDQLGRGGGNNGGDVPNDGGVDWGAYVPIVDASTGPLIPKDRGACTATPLRIPLHITTRFGVNDPSHPVVPHSGRDYRAPVGTPVYAPETGRVEYAGALGSAGNAVIIQSPSVNTYLFHLSRVAVTRGQSVIAGAIVAYSGNTGHSTGPHLHFEQTSPGPITLIPKDRDRIDIEPCGPRR